MTFEVGEMTTLHKGQLRLQQQLDAVKTQVERNKLGQFATPPALANAMVKATQAHFSPSIPVRFLDPAFGTGAFYAALRQVYKADQIEQAVGVEIDPHYGQPAQAHWQETGLELTVADFTRLTAPTAESPKPNLIICNPPYTRHHHLSPQYKEALGQQARAITGIKLNGLAGLYCYFLLIAHNWLAANGIGCWLIPGEFLDVNYGQEVKAYLLNKVRLLRIHRFDPADRQFEDALVSSVVVWFRQQTPQADDEVEFTTGGTLEQPKSRQIFLNQQLNSQTKWSKLFSGDKRQQNGRLSHSPTLKISDLFHIKRGVATGANGFFILTLEQIQQYQLLLDYFVPILPSPRYLAQDQILANSDGFPLVEKPLFLLNCHLPEREVQENHPHLWAYLEKGKKQKIHERYLCRHRSPWYAQESRLPAPILCTYMGRSERPFKFILNHSQAIAPNVYLMLYPKKSMAQQIEANPELLTMVWQTLKGIESKTLIGEGRVYGGGLFKIEPGELGNVCLTGIEEIFPLFTPDSATQLALL